MRNADDRGHLEARICRLEQAIVALSLEVELARASARSAQAALVAAPAPVNDWASA